MVEWKTCQTCDGKGAFYGETCETCGGIGKVSVSPSTAPTVEVDERAAFEAWFTANRFGGMKDSMWAAWEGRAALASKPPAREAATAYVPPHVLEALRAGCKVATTLTPGKEADHTEAVQLLPNNN
jgi:hypothetical protein